MNFSQIIGKGFSDRLLGEEEVHVLVNEAFETWNLCGKRVLVLIPDGTRTAPIPFFFRIFYELLANKVKSLDYLVALGTHPVMSEDALNKLVGITKEERTSCYSNINLYNHLWHKPDTFVTLGTISAEEANILSEGRLSSELPVRINRLVMDYDIIVVCGPVFPHEVVGYSGGSKYFSPGISGLELINFTHWLGALISSYEIIGNKNTAVRAVIDRVADFIPRPK